MPMPNNNINQPYPGLRSFSVNERKIFFGRDELINGLIKKLETNKFLAIMGDSGSGKSSLAMAGIQYDLTNSGEYGKWDCMVMRPEDQPVKNLAKGLRSLGQTEPIPDNDKLVRFAEIELKRGFGSLVEMIGRLKLEGKLLIIIDQFEELFRFKSKDEKSRENALHFVRLLLEAIKQTDSPIHVLITMRSEFLGNCSEFVGLPEIISDSQFVIPRLTREQYRKAIIRPAELAGVNLTNGFVSSMLNDIEDEKDQLPLLQHSLMRVWEASGNMPNNETGIIDHNLYNEKNRIGSALNNHAEEIYKNLSKAEKQIADRVFKCITEMGAENKGIRRPQKLREIIEVVGKEQRQTIVSVLDKYRAEGVNMLRPFVTETKELKDESKIDITHEALMRVWKRLVRWVEEEAANANLCRQLIDRSGNYFGDGGELLTGLDLAAAIKLSEGPAKSKKWVQRYTDDIPEKYGEGENHWYNKKYDMLIAYIKKGKRKENLNRILTIALIIGIFASLSLVIIYIRQNQEKKEIITKNKVITEQANSLQTQKDSLKRYNEYIEEVNQELADKAVEAKELENKAVNSAKQANTEAKKAREATRMAEQQAAIATRKTREAESLNSQLQEQLGEIKKLIESDSAKADSISKLNNQALALSDIQRHARDSIFSEPSLAYRLAEFLYKKDYSAEDILRRAFYIAKLGTKQKQYNRNNICFSWDGMNAVSWTNESNDNAKTQLKFWKLTNSDKPQPTVKSINQLVYITFVTSSPLSPKFITVEKTGVITLWDGNNFSAINRANSGLNKIINAGAISPSGEKFLITSGQEIEEWGIDQKGNFKPLIDFTPKNSFISSIEYSLNGENWITMNSDGNAYLYEPVTSSIKKIFSDPMKEVKHVNILNTIGVSQVHSFMDEKTNVYYYVPPIEYGQIDHEQKTSTDIKQYNDSQKNSVISPIAIFYLVDNQKIYGNVWQLDTATKKKYGIE